MSLENAPSLDQSAPAHTPPAAPLAAVAAGVGWAWAVLVLASRDHMVGSYEVAMHVAPGRGVFVAGDNCPLSAPFALGGGIALAFACLFVARRRQLALPTPCCWLLLAYIIPVLDLLRIRWLAIPVTFFEPLFLTGITYAAVAAVVRQARQDRSEPSVVNRAPWTAAVWLSAALCGIWWYFQGRQWHNNFLLGFNDFGQFALRVANTWEGRGFLSEAAGLPAFWDHFNPGLIALVPLWPLWPDAKLFLLIQAVCLAVPAPIVYGIARRFGAGSAGAAAWAGAYLVFPAVGQLNLNYTYGWHPVSAALPLLFLAVWALLGRRKGLAAAAAACACAFKENVIVLVCLFSLTMALRAWLDERRAKTAGRVQSASEPLAGQLSAGAWLAAALAALTAFLLVYRFAAFPEYQTARFSRLGDTALEILASPVARPAVFWGEVFRERSACFLLSLAVPLGFVALYRGRWVLFPLALPVFVLLAWDHEPATSIAFQYTTTLIPLLMAASIAGAAAPDPAPHEQEPHERSRRLSLASAGFAALCAGATASLAIGGLPWSSPTLTRVRNGTYPVVNQRSLVQERAVGSPGNAVLQDIISRVRTSDSRVLATGRIAAHLIGVERLETVGQAVQKQRWMELESEAGGDRSGVLVFDWIVIDLFERFQQRKEETDFILREAGRADYWMVQRDYGIAVFRKPSAEPSGSRTAN